MIAERSKSKTSSKQTISFYTAKGMDTFQSAGVLSRFERWRVWWGLKLAHWLFERSILSGLSILDNETYARVLPKDEKTGNDGMSWKKDQNLKNK